MNTYQLQVLGMTCDHCARTVEKALNAIDGAQAKVSFKENIAYIQSEKAIDPNRLIQAVKAAGYVATLLQDQNKKTTPKKNGDAALHIVILGGGSAAFACALRAAESGSRVTIVERSTLGGTCVNVGCVPSKIMIRESELAYQQDHHPFIGLEKHKAKINRVELVAQQQKRVDELRYDKYQSLIDTIPNITLLQGIASFQDAHTISVKDNQEKEQTLHPDRILIATGASPMVPPIPGLKETPYWTSTEALVADKLPEHLIVLGGSAVGLELGQAFLHLGRKVTVIELFSLLPKEDKDISDGLKKILEEDGMVLYTQTETKKIRFDGQHFHVELESMTIKGDRLLVATGRKPNTNELNLDKVGIKTDSRGAIIIDDHLMTNVKHIYAAGDCTALPQFVYVAASAGTRAAINMMGGNMTLDLATMPAVVFTDPQVASVGLTEQAAKKQGINAESRILTLDNVPRALVNFDTRGVIKLVADQETGQLLGAQVLAAEASEIIQIVALAIHNKMSVRTLSEQLFPYLTMAEGIKLCAQTFFQDVKKLSCCAG